MTWSEAFDAWMIRSNTTNAAVATILGVAESTIHYWRHRGSEPRGKKGRELKKRIELLSKGEVKAAPWSVPPSAAKAS